MTELREIRFVILRQASVFVVEFLEAIAAAVRDAGMPATLSTGFPYGEPGVVPVVVPDEWFAAHSRDAWPGPAMLARTVALCIQQPGTPEFDAAYDHARRCGAVMDISPVGATEFRRLGIEAQHLPLGYLPQWDDWGGEEDAERPVDVLFIGSVNRRRQRLIAGYASTLWKRRCRWIVSGGRQAAMPAVEFVAGPEKRRLLKQAKLLIVPCRSPAPYFGWLRAVEAIANGCVVVCEHPAGSDPLVTGDHFLSGHGESLALVADAFLHEPERIAEIRRAAYEALRERAPVRAGAERLVAVAERLAANPPPARSAAPTEPTAQRQRSEAPEALAPIVKRLTLDVIALRRRVGNLEARLDGMADPREPLILYRTPAWEAAQPRVSVCIPCFNHAPEVDEALASVAAQDHAGLEVLVLDDGSTDDSQATARRAMEARPWLPATLLAMPVNAGLPAARNRLATHARGEFVLMLDADNSLYPPAVERLVAALQDDREALFAYPILEGHVDGQPTALLSYRAWDPSLFRTGNYIDALALLRRERLLDIGGYAEDLELYGWEDYDLWLRAADLGLHGVHVPEILARYRLASGSMRSLTDIDTTELRALLRDRHPRTLGAAGA